MPTTYNGVGTHYYGKKYKRSRQAVCQHCGQRAELTSFETRLWFVFLYIPLFPMGRKRISEQCSVCSRHFATAARQWQIDRQAAISVAVNKYRQEHSEAAALEVHGQLIGFQQHEHAEEFRKTMLTEFSGNAAVHAGLASHLEFIGLPKQAAKLWDRAWELDPDLPETRVGIGRRRMREGKLQEARELLSFLEEPGAEQQYSLDPLFDLAGHCQQNGDHKEALSIFESLLRAFPALVNDHAVRQFIKTSEKAAKPDKSILPQVEHSVGRLFSRQYSSGQRWLVGVSIAVVLALIGMASNNEYIRHHRPLTVINDTGVPATVQIDDQPPVSVLGMQTLAISEGSRRVRISGPVQEEHLLEISSDYWHRWTRNPVWIVNVGGAGIIADVKVQYAVRPRSPIVRLIADPVIIRSHVDCPFEEPPKTVEVSGELDVKIRSVISWVRLDRDDRGIQGYYMLNEYDRQQAFAFAERALQQMPDDEDLIRALSSDVRPEQRPRYQTLLESKLNHRPVILEWHRAYQEIPAVYLKYDKLISRYDGMLQADRGNAKLLYLRGRIDKDPAKNRKLIEAAATADPTFAFARFSLGFKDLAAGRWRDALDNISQAVELGLPENRAAVWTHVAMLGLKQYDELEKIHREHLEKKPTRLSSAALLAELLTITGRVEEAKQTILQTNQAFQKMTENAYPDGVYGNQFVMSYLDGNLVECARICALSESLKTSLRAITIEAGRVDEVTKNYSLSAETEDQWIPLMCCLGYQCLGERQKADLWYQKAIDQFRRQGPKSEFLTHILETETITPDLINDVRLVSDRPLNKAVLLTCLGLRAESRDIGEPFYQEARRLMVRRTIPYGLLQKIHAKLDTQQ